MCFHQAQAALHLPLLATTSTAYTPAGAVMGWMTVEMALMKLTVPLIFHPPVHLNTLPVTTKGVSPKRGCVMVTMTVEMAPMNATAVGL